MGRAWVAGAVAAAAVMLCASGASAFGYEVKSGDTFAGLAKRFYGSSAHWERIATANAGRLVPGKTILIPEEGDPDNPGARIAAVSGTVELRAPADEGWVAAKAADPLLWQRSLRTGKRGSSQLVLRDGAKVHVGPDTELTVLGDTGDRLRITLERGAVELAAEKASGLEIVVGESIWSLEGRSVTLRCDASHVVVGAADGTARSVDTSVENGRAVRVRGDGVVERKTKLPGAPEFPDGERVVLGFGGAMDLSWASPDPAVGFDVEVAGRRSTVNGPHATIPVRSTGLVRARVRARGELGAPGPWAEHAVYALVAEASRDPLPSNGEATRFVGTVSLRFRDLPRGSSLFARLDGGLPRKLRKALRLDVTGVGEHELQIVGQVVVGGEKVEVDAKVPLELAPIPGVTVEFQPGTLDPLDSPPEVRIVVRLRDEDDRAVRGERPVVTVGARSCTALPTKVAGEYACALRPRAAPGIQTLDLVVRGEGGSFVATRQFTVQLPDQAAIRVK